MDATRASASHFIAHQLHTAAGGLHYVVRHLLET